MLQQVSKKDLTEKDLELVAHYSEERHYFDEWDEPIKYDEHSLPEFNVDVFPAWLKNFVIAVAETTQTPAEMPSMAAISILSIALTKNYEINPYGDWVEPLNTYCLTLMGPANRKSSVFREMSSPVIQFQKEEANRLKLEAKKIDSTKRSLQKRIEHLEGSYAKNGDDNIFLEIAEAQQELDSLSEVYLPTYVSDDATPETIVTLMKQNRERLAVISAEAGLFDMVKGRYSGQVNLEVYLKGHTGDYLRVDRQGRTEILESPLLTIGLFGQPDSVRNLPPVFHGRGLMARFLYSSPKDFKGYRDVRPKSIPPEVRTKYINNIKLLMSQTVKEPVILRLNQDADSLFESFQKILKYNYGMAAPYTRYQNGAGN